MDTFQNILYNYEKRFLKKINNVNYIEQNYFSYANDHFKNEVNKYEYVNSHFVNLVSNINTTKNLCIVDISLILTFKFENKLYIQPYLLSLFSKNKIHTFSYEKLKDTIVLDNVHELNLENLKFIENIDVLSRKNSRYFHYNIDKEINFENINIVKNIISNIIK